MSSGGMGTPDRNLTQNGKVSSEVLTLRNGQKQWRLDGVVTSKLFKVLIKVGSDYFLHHEGIR